MIYHGKHLLMCWIADFEFPTWWVVIVRSWTSHEYSTRDEYFGKNLDTRQGHLSFLIFSRHDEEGYLSWLSSFAKILIIDFSIPSYGVIATGNLSHFPPNLEGLLCGTSLKLNYENTQESADGIWTPAQLCTSQARLAQ